MPTISKIGIIICFFGALLLGFQFVDIRDSGIAGNYRLIKKTKFDVISEQSLLRTNSEMRENKEDIEFVVEGRLKSTSKGTEFDLGNIYYTDGTVKNILRDKDQTLFEIKPKSLIRYKTKQFEDGYLLKVQFPEELLYQDFSLSLNLDLIREYIYDGSRTDTGIKNDLIDKNGGITISSVRYMPSALSLLKGQLPMIVSIVILSIGLLITVVGIIVYRKNQKKDIGVEMELEKELDEVIEETHVHVDSKIHDKFKGINQRLRRIIKIEHDSTLDFSKITEACKTLVNNALILAKFKAGFNKLKDIADIGFQAEELDKLKVQYTKEHDFTKKIEILSLVKAKERVIFFLENIDKKAEQIEDMISNVESLLESTILTFPAIKREASGASQSSIAALRRKLISEIEIQEKEIDMLKNVTQKRSSPKKIESTQDFIEGE